MRISREETLGREQALDVYESVGDRIHRGWPPLVCRSRGSWHPQVPCPGRSHPLGNSHQATCWTVHVWTPGFGETGPERQGSRSLAQAWRSMHELAACCCPDTPKNREVAVIGALHTQIEQLSEVMTAALPAPGR